MKLESEEKRLIGDSYSADPDALRRLRAMSQQTGMSKAALIRSAIAELLEKFDEPEDNHASPIS